jgi:hypothetical protein
MNSVVLAIRNASQRKESLNIRFRFHRRERGTRSAWPRRAKRIGADPLLTDIIAMQTLPLAVFKTYIVVNNANINIFFL